MAPWWENGRHNCTSSSCWLWRNRRVIQQIMPAVWELITPVPSPIVPPSLSGIGLIYFRSYEIGDKNIILNVWWSRMGDHLPFLLRDALHFLDWGVIRSAPISYCEKKFVDNKLRIRQFNFKKTEFVHTWKLHGKYVFNLAVCQNVPYFISTIKDNLLLSQHVYIDETRGCMLVTIEA